MIYFNYVIYRDLLFLELGEFPRNNRSVRARTRWHLAYTLINNPQLGHMRRRDGESDEDEDEKKSFMLYVAQHKVFLKLRQKFKSIEKWAAELEESGGEDDDDDQDTPVVERMSRDLDDRASRDSRRRGSHDSDDDDDESRDSTRSSHDRNVSCLVEWKPNGPMDDSRLEVIASFGERAIIQQDTSKNNTRPDTNTHRLLNTETSELNCTGEIVENSNVSAVHL